MKILVLMFTLLCAAGAQAGLITVSTDQNTYNTGDTVIVELGVQNMNPAIDFLELDFSFDLAELEFVAFSWFDSAVLFDFGAFGDAFLDFFSDDMVIVQASFLDGIVDVATSTFALGQLEFVAQSDLTSVNLSLDSIFAQDFDFNEIAEADLQVSAPALGLLVLTGFALLLTRRKV